MTKDKHFEGTETLTQFNEAVKAYGVRGLASQLGITPAYVSMVVNGKRPLTSALLTRLNGLVSSVNGTNVNTPWKQIVSREGFEPTTHGLKVRCSTS
jgi:plasmid maintenance system antidote protein VapI